jgi:hypothetical protein
MGDLGRLDAQKRFATAVLGEIRTSLSPTQIPSLMRTLLSHTKSDLCLSDCVYFGRQVLNLSPEDLTLVTLPGYVVGNDYVLNRSGTLDLLGRYFNVYAAEIPPAVFDRAQVFNLPNTPAVDAKYHGKSPLAEDLQVDYIGSWQNAAKERNYTWNLHLMSLPFVL